MNVPQLRKRPQHLPAGPGPVAVWMRAPLVCPDLVGGAPMTRTRIKAALTAAAGAMALFVVAGARPAYGRVSVYVEPRDWWVGVYRGPNAAYLCPLPCLVIKVSRP